MPEKKPWEKLPPRDTLPERVTRVINFIERFCTHTRGSKWAGRPFKLHWWQEAAIIDIFGPVKPDGFRQIRTAYIEIAKKNGKSEFCAALALYFLIADGEEGAEVYIAAAARKQAENIFQTCAQMVRNSTWLQSRLRVYETTKTIVVKGRPLNFLRAISADANTEDGLNGHCVIFDELHRQKKRDLWDVLKKGSSTREQPMMVAITTAGIEGESPICHELHTYASDLLAGHHHDPSFYACIYSLDEDEDWTDEENWKRVNPAMTGPLQFKFIDGLRDDLKIAQRLPAQENSFRRFELCQWVQEAERWIPLSEWDKPEMSRPFHALKDLAGEICYGGLDLSSVADLTAFVLVFPDWEKGIFRIWPKFWIPRKTMKERDENEREKFEQWAAAGFLEITETRSVDMGAVVQTIESLANVFAIHEIAYDPWAANKIENELDDRGFQLVKFSQTIKNFTSPSRAFERYVLNDSIHHGGHPILRWNVDCVSVRRNTFDEIAPARPDRRKSLKRIDGVVAMIMALDRAERNRPEDLEDFLENPVIAG